MTFQSLGTNRRLERRTFLKAAGCAIGLPLLDAMRPAFGAATKAVPRRMVAIETNQGIMPQFFFPETGGVALAKG